MEIIVGGRIMTKRWAYNIKRKYKISVDQYIDAFNKQDGKCAICFDDRCFPLFVDHCHKTKTARGLICRKCNYGIALFKDDISTVERLLGYLRYAKL